MPGLEQAAIGAQPAHAPQPKRIRGRYLYGAMTLVSLIVGVASLKYHAAATYDPWSWLVWGREIIHGHLSIHDGSSWKPLPVIFTTVFALFGSAAPNLWIAVERAALVLSLLMAFRLAWRLTWDLTGTDQAIARQRNPIWRLALFAAPALAGLFALYGLAMVPPYLTDSLLGNSESMMLAAAMIAAERFYDGHHRQAFAIGAIVALDRPEPWLIWIPFGLWLIYRDRQARAYVGGLILFVLLLWCVPAQIGGGSLSAIASTAQSANVGSAKFASCPFCAEITGKAFPLVAILSDAAAVAIALYGLWSLYANGYRVSDLRRCGRLRTGAAWNQASARSRSLTVATLFAIFGWAWFTLIAIFTQIGFSGNPRYLELGSVFIGVAGCTALGAGAGWAAEALATRWQAGSRAWLRAPATVGTTLFVAIVFFMVPHPFGYHRTMVIGDFKRTIDQSSEVRASAEQLIAEAGGPSAFTSCKPLMVEAFEIPQVAWDLNVPTRRLIEDPPAGLKSTSGPYPQAIFQSAPPPYGAMGPTNAEIAAWEQEGAHYRVFRTPLMNLYMDCA